eukprot:gene14721-biopygen3617
MTHARDTINGTHSRAQSREHTGANGTCERDTPTCPNGAHARGRTRDIAFRPSPRDPTLARVWRGHGAGVARACPVTPGVLGEPAAPPRLHGSRDPTRLPGGGALRLRQVVQMDSPMLATARGGGAGALRCPGRDG